MPEPMSTAERVEHGVLGVAAAVGGGWAAPAILEALGQASRRGDPDLIVAFMILFLLFGATLFGLAVSLRGNLGWPLARWIAAPLGAWRSAAYLARHANTWKLDPEGGAALAGALALLHRDAHDVEAAANLSEQIAGATTLGTAGIAASGLLLASRGDRDGARELLHGALQLEGRKALAPAQTIAREWLIADAAARGDWSRVVELGDEPWRSVSLRARLLIGVAGRFVGAHSPTDAGLRLLWILQPRREALRELVERALALPQALHPRRFERGADAPDAAARARGDVDALPELPEAPLPRALVLHAHWSARDPLLLRLVPSRLGELCAAWDAAADSGAIARRTATRAAALEIAGKAEALRERFLGEVAGDLAELTIAAEVPLAEVVPEPGPLTERALAEVRGRVLLEVEELAEALDQRKEEGRALPAVDEWREWERLRRLYERAGRLCGMELRYVMFPQVHRIACAFAVWLWNDRKEYPISKPIFRWLLDEAEAVGDQSAIDLQRKNLGVKGG
ncbi:MAG: hypothetical protein R3A79_14645 [Nannocystaceae bacterium]